MSGVQIERQGVMKPTAVAANGLILTSGDNVATPDSAGLSITGDIDLRIQCSLPDWSPAADVVLFNKWSTSFILQILAGGVLQFALHTATQFPEYSLSNSALAVTDGATKWVRATRSGTTYAQYISDDGSSWTTVPCTPANASFSAILDGTESVTVGLGAGGTLYRAILMNGIAGTVVGDFDSSLVTKLGAQLPTTYTDAQGNVWTPSGGWSWG